ncbi:MAG: hypothetical protein ACLFU8_07520 [Anaerolineales bacterium]
MIRSKLTRQQETSDLVRLFSSALEQVQEKRNEINQLDDYNHNHGDNTVRNLRTVVNALQEHESEPPAQALYDAGERLAREGEGTTSQYYARALRRAAEQFRGQERLDEESLVNLVEILLGSVPARYTPTDVTRTPSVLERLVQHGDREEGVDLGALASQLLPAGLTYLQAKQAGEDTGTAAQRALLNTLLGDRSVSRGQGDYRVAAAESLGRGLLRSLFGGR